jgi:hypothetical protein
VRDDSIALPVALAILILGFAVFGMGAAAGMSNIRQEAISRGHMIHNPTTGELEWVEKEGEE